MLQKIYYKFKIYVEINFMMHDCLSYIWSLLNEKRKGIVWVNTKLRIILYHRGVL